MHGRRVGDPQGPPVAWLLITALLPDKRKTSQVLAHLTLEVLSHKTTQIRVFLVFGASGAASQASENSFCRLALCSDASDEQNSQSSMENSINSSEKAERQPSAESGLAAETSAVSQVSIRSQPRWGGARLLRGPLKSSCFTVRHCLSIGQRLNVLASVTWSHRARRDSWSCLGKPLGQSMHTRVLVSAW